MNHKKEILESSQSNLVVTNKVMELQSDNYFVHNN